MMSTQERDAVHLEIGKLNEQISKLARDLREQDRVSQNLRADVVRMETEAEMFREEIRKAKQPDVISIKGYRDVQELASQHHEALEQHRVRLAMSDNQRRALVTQREAAEANRERLRGRLEETARVIPFPTKEDRGAA